MLVVLSNLHNWHTSCRTVQGHGCPQSYYHDTPLKHLFSSHTAIVKHVTPILKSCNYTVYSETPVPSHTTRVTHVTPILKSCDCSDTCDTYPQVITTVIHLSSSHTHLSSSHTTTVTHVTPILKLYYTPIIKSCNNSDKCPHVIQQRVTHLSSSHTTRVTHVTHILKSYNYTPIIKSYNYSDTCPHVIQLE